MGTPSTAATAGIAASAYGLGAIISANIVWYDSLQVPKVDVPSTISDGWAILIGACIQAIGHAIHWYVNRKVATGASVVLTPAK